VLVDVKVTPKAKRNALHEDGGVLRVQITAAPEDGKANKAVVKLLSKHFGVRQKAVRIVRGETSRTKKVEIEGLPRE
jgi:uncharacterized protein (TIGR00251 family)